MADVLLVDDEKSVRSTLAIMLNEEIQTAIQESTEDVAAGRVRVLQVPDEI